MSRDSVGEIPVFPPTMALSPSGPQNGKGMSVQSGEGGLGVGNVPVKKLPGMADQRPDINMDDA